MKVNILTAIVVAVMATATAAPTGSSNLAEVNEALLDQTIEAKVNSMLADEPVLKTIYIGRDGSNNLKMSAGDLSASISLDDPSQPATSPNNLLAYRPKYSDYHSSGLAGIFINLDGLFPCSSGHLIPNCARFTQEEDGFNKGKALLQAGDGGNHFGGIFGSSDIAVYGLAFQGCEENCFPPLYSIRVFCFLPREYCG